MKILCNIGHGANGFMKEAWRKVFVHLGHEFFFWNPDAQDADFVFNQVEPDIFLGTTYNFNIAQLKCIEKRPNMKVAMIAADWGPLIDTIDFNKYTMVAATEHEIKLIKLLKETTGKPDFLFIHYHKNRLEDTHSYWTKKLGIKVTAITQCADVFDYSNGEHTSQLESDIAFIGGYWPYKALNLNKYLLPLCKRYGKYKIRIYGNQGWPVAQYKGPVDTSLVKDIFASSLICPNISEPHADLGFELMERPFKVLSSGGFCISQYNKTMAEDIFTNNEIPFFKNYGEFIELIDYFTKNPDERKKHINAGHYLVMAKHTNFDRVEQFFREFGFEDEASKCSLAKLKFEA